MSDKKQTKLIDISKEDIKGLQLERDAHQFLWDSGYIVFSRIIIYAMRYKYKDQRESIEKFQVTDLDCYGIFFGNLLEKNTFLIDCKHRSENIFSQIMRLKGISSILGIDNLLILRDSIKQIVQHFGDKFNIKLLTNDSFRKRMKMRGSGSFHLGVFKKLFRFLRKEGTSIIDIEAKFSNCFLDINPFLRIKKLRKLYNDIKQQLDYKNENLEFSLEIYYLFRTFIYSLVTIVEMASRTIHQSPYHFDEFLELNLIGDYEFKKRLLFQINMMTKDNDTAKKELNPIKVLKPSFTESLKVLIKDFHQHSNLVQKFLRYDDFVFHEYLLLNKTMDSKEIEVEFNTIDANLFAGWNLKCLEILDEEKIFPIFLVKLLT